MTLETLVTKLEARIVHGGRTLAAEIRSVYAGDKMSDLLEHAGSRTLIVTSLANPQLLRVAELMDLPGICLVGSIEPEEELALAAAAADTTLLVSPFGMFETCGRLYGVMGSTAGESA